MKYEITSVCGCCSAARPCAVIDTPTGAVRLCLGCLQKGVRRCSNPGSKPAQPARVVVKLPDRWEPGPHPDHADDIIDPTGSYLRYDDVLAALRAAGAQVAP